MLQVRLLFVFVCPCQQLRGEDIAACPRFRADIIVCVNGAGTGVAAVYDFFRARLEGFDRLALSPWYACSAGKSLQQVSHSGVGRKFSTTVHTLVAPMGV